MSGLSVRIYGKCAQYPIDSSETYGRRAYGWYDNSLHHCAYLVVAATTPITHPCGLLV